MPKFGDLAECQACGNEIKWIGPYWQHTTCSPRHPGKPKTVREPPVKAMTPEFQEVLRNDTLVAALWHLGVPLEDMVVQMAKRHEKLMQQVTESSAALSHQRLQCSKHRIIGDPRGDEDG